MGIGEKKSVLRTMYNKTPQETPPADAPAPAEPHPRAEAFEKRVETLVTILVHAGMYLLALIGLAGIAAMLYSQYADGRSMEFTLHLEKMFREIIFLVAMAILLIVLAVTMFIFFREKLPRRARWIPLLATVALFPAVIVAAFFLEPCFQAGRAAAYAALDRPTLLEDAKVISGLVTLTDFQPFDLDSANPVFSSLPKYTESTLHPSRIIIHVRGIEIWQYTSGGLSWGDTEGLIIMLAPTTPAEAEAIAAKHNLELLSKDPPIFRVKSMPGDTTFLDDPKHPTTAPGPSIYIR